MMTFLKGLGIVFALMVAGLTVAVTAPQIGLWVGLTFLVVPVVALFKPLPQLHLGHRGFSIAVAVFVGMMTTLASVGSNADSQKMAELRTTDPTAYLAALETRDRTKWLIELKELAPERFAAERARAAEAEAARKAEADAAEATRVAEQERAAARKQAEAEAAHQADQDARVAAYVEQLDREIASLPGVSASKYTGDVNSITTGLILLGAWALVYEEGGKLPLMDEARAKRAQFRRLLADKQVQFLPALRDAYGPAMRRQLWEADGSARTFGAGYKTVEFVSVAFARNANIKQIHTEIQENLMMLRFTRTQYKWIKEASEFSYYDMEVPKDSDIVTWESGGRWRVLE